MSRYKDVMTKLAADVASKMSTGDASWSPPWYRYGPPRNVITEAPYRGMNHYRLLLSDHERTDIWGTFRQWKSRGTHVLKGAKGEQIVRWVATKDRTEEGGRPSTMVPKVYTVFSADQVADPPPEAPRREHSPTLTDMWLEDNPGAPIHYDPAEDRAFYSPGTDMITLPAPEMFHTADDLYATSFHELVHSTGHKSRCDRPLRNRAGSTEYAFEELIAEFGAAALCHHHGVQPSMPAGHAEYLALWARHITDDPKFLTRAISAADSAVKYLLPSVPAVVPSGNTAQEVKS